MTVTIEMSITVTVITAVTAVVLVVLISTATSG